MTGAERTIMVQWTGDISLDGLFCDPQQHESLANNMRDIAIILGKVDLRIGNLESPLWGDGHVNTLKVPRLATTREAARCLLPLELDVVLLGNNHAFDCRLKGFENTIQFLDEHGIAWLGAGRTREEAERPYIIERKGKRIGLLNYVGPETNPNVSPDSGFFLNTLKEDRVVEEVSSLSRDTDIVLVHFHWGSIELVRCPTVRQRRLARKAIEAGARVVVGTHPHCLQGHEFWKGGHIFYSLGNFLFSRYAYIPGRNGIDWPLFSQEVTIAQCDFSGTRTDFVGRRRFLQKELILKSDTRRSRRISETLSDALLALPDELLNAAWRAETLYQWSFALQIHNVFQRGGAYRAIRRLKWHHLRAIVDGFEKTRTLE